MKNKGLFVTFEGTEGTGKSTQAEMLASYLRDLGYNPVVTREPGGTPFADEIRELVLSPAHDQMDVRAEALLYAASRAQHVAELVEPALEQGRLVISDRFVDSSVAYQAFGRNLPPDVIHDINTWATRGIKPDITFLLMLPVEEGLMRATKQSADRIERETVAFHKRVLVGFRHLARENPDRVQMIDGTGSKEDVHGQIKALVGQLL